MQVCPHVVLISAQKVQFPLELAWRLCCKLYSNSEAKLAEANITHTLVKLCARVVVFFYLILCYHSGFAGGTDWCVWVLLRF